MLSYLACWFFCYRYVFIVFVNLLKFQQFFLGKYHLEDPSGTVELDLSSATYHTGLFTENCVVFIEGTLNLHSFCILHRLVLFSNTYRRVGSRYASNRVSICMTAIHRY